MTGLTSQIAAEKLLRFGPNEIERKQQVSWVRIIFDQLRSPLIYILIFAGLITFFLGKNTDSIIIFVAVFINTILGFFQELKAEKSLLALQQLIVPHAWVIRDNQEKYLPARELVPGDLAILKTGEKVPADGMVIEAVDLYLNEAILTGESEPVRKNIQNQVFMGTVVVAGRGRMLVVKTGMRTQVGKIAAGLQHTTAEKTPLKIQIGKLSKFLALAMLVISLLILIEGLIQGRDLVEMFTLSVAIAVAAIPEGLIISVTTILVLGMQRLLTSKVLVRKLLAAETLGSVSCICADKTGTLTEGKMRVVKTETTNDSLMVKAALLCNNLINPLEMAMFAWAEKEAFSQGDFKKDKILSQVRLTEIPFSSQNKYTAVLYPDYLFVSGAPEKILNLCQLADKEKKHWQKQIDKYASLSYRLLAFAYQPNKGNKKIKESEIKKGHLYWLGLAILEDPVRKEVASVLKDCQRAGIKIKVITGDYQGTATAILNQLQIVEGGLTEEQIMDGEKLSKISLGELIKVVDGIILFCRTSPEQKIKIVQALKEKGEVVAMMGDGVNDALALKKADIGIVVGEASEVAKETAGMILLDSNFKSVLEAVKIGRGIFRNIKKVVLYLLSDSFTEVILISGALLLGLPTPLLAVQILWVNLVEDGLPGIALAFEKEEEGLLDEPPRRKDAPILDKELKIIIFIIGVVADIGLFALFFLLYQAGVSLELIRTIIFVCLGMDSLFYIFSCKSLNKNLWETPVFNNTFLNFAVLVGIFLLFGAIYLPFLQVLLKTVPLPLWGFSLLIVFAILKVAIIELVKRFFKEK